MGGYPLARPDKSDEEHLSVLPRRDRAAQQRLDLPGVLEALADRQTARNGEVTGMEHLLLKATTTAADEGVFEAVISSAVVDRERDIVDPHGMVRALQKWTQTGKRIPLAWNHSTKAEDQIGHIDPASARVAGGEVVAAGWIDQSTSVGAEAWRLVKSGTLGFSFGYLIVKGESRKGGGKHIRELDVFEITATPTPVQNDTRVLSYKQMADDSAEDEDDPAELLGQMISLAQDFIDDETDPDDVAAMREIMRGLLALQGTEADESDTGKGLRRRADDIALEHAVGKEPPPAQVRLASAVTTADTKTCEECGGEFYKKPNESRAYWDTKRFCSTDCKGKGHSRAMRRGEVTSRGTAFRQSARNYLQNKCAICGWDETSCDVAHIEPRIDELDNVIMLCPNHHRMYDQGGIPRDEMKGLREGTLDPGTPLGARFKTEWSTSFINSLPDSAFLYVEPGGTKDSEGKTVPRSNRHFPYKDASGAVDLPHLRNALARIPQSNLSQSLKDSLTAKAQRILNNSKSVPIADAADPETTRPRSADPLRRKADATALDYLSAGESRRKPPRRQDPPKPQPELELRELRRRTRETTLTALSGVDINEQV